MSEFPDGGTAPEFTPEGVSGMRSSGKPAENTGVEIGAPVGSSETPRDIEVMPYASWLLLDGEASRESGLSSDMLLEAAAAATKAA